MRFFSQYVQNDEIRDIVPIFTFFGDYNTIGICVMLSCLIVNMGVKACMNKLKGILMWNFWMLEHVGIISSNAYSGFLMALQDVPLPS